MNNPSIAILLAAYNGKNWIAEQIKSILEQRKVDVIIYISVDISTDGTMNILENLFAKEKRIEILPYGERFGAAAPNFYRLIRDVKFSDFDFVAFSDQDDVWFSDKLFRAVQVLKKEKCDGYSSDVLAFWSNGKKKLLRKSQSQRKYDYLFEGAGPGCSCVMSNSLACALKDCVSSNWNLVNSIDWHDWLAYAFARANNYKWIIDPKPGMLYRQHENNQIGMNNGIKAFLKRAEKIINGYGFEQAQKIAFVTGADKDSYIKELLSGSRKRFLLLALNAKHCRRKRIDVLYLLFASLIMYLNEMTARPYKLKSIVSERFK